MYMYSILYIYIYIRCQPDSDRDPGFTACLAKQKAWLRKRHIWVDMKNDLETYAIIQVTELG